LSGVDDNSLIDDTRYKTHKFYYKVYPYTIEYYVEVERKSTLFFPPWTPQPQEGIAVEQSNMTIKYPADYTLRYKAFNYKMEPVSMQEKDSRSLTWNLRTAPAIWKESFSPLWHELATMVIFGPGDFQMDEYKGSMLSWEDFGKFIYRLKQDKDQLPEQTKKEIHALADPLSDSHQKIAILYEYMQKHTRYISIQLGIGGFQPFDANEVISKGYGDCKALSNLMYSILKEAGIASCYTLIRAGSDQNYITTDFPSQQFNHAILCVPQPKDTVWLECTSQTLPAGYLSDFTCNRPALLINENGGTLVQTPLYKMVDNVQARNIKAVLDEEGTLNLQVNCRYTCLQQDQIHGMINALSKEKIKEYLLADLDFATYTINRFNYKEDKKLSPAIDEELNITVSNYANFTGKRLFINPNVMNRAGRKLNQDSLRKNDIILNREYIDQDSVEIEIPAGYTAESIPADILLNSKFGKYTSSVKLSGNKLYYYRTLERKSGRFPASVYSELVNFYETIYRSDRNKMVLVKQ
jgi:hypothetical protein